MCSLQVKPIPLPNLVSQPLSYIERLDLNQLFTPGKPLEVELGAGDGSFLVQWAALNPDRNFLGVERLLGRLRKINRKAARLQLKNVRLLRIEAAYFLEYMLPPASVSALHVYFPDPWPKRKQQKNRLINAPFVQAAAKALVPGGLIYLRTDDPDYFQQMQSVFAAHRSFQASKTPAELQRIITDFERGFRARGVQTFQAAFQHSGEFTSLPHSKI
ncbi:MAG TPA: tRNA (guanosine(46)-N7)-methyltransferase TrmB [Verrucomicrobiae bacterium]|nr:tRNA (guanosine(46)-N7)-methyltransferase TrmB [Verrucomicrobiae bacterium]